MNMLNSHRCSSLPHRRGVILPLVAVMLPVMIIMLGFSVDLAFMQSTRAELRAATDAAARAGSIILSQTEDEDLARQAAIDMASRNQVAGKALAVATSDIEVGRSDPDDNGVWQFVDGATPYNSVRVTGDRTANSLGGGISLFFGALRGNQDFEPKVTSTSTFVNVDLCLVLDRSGSMNGSKMSDLQEAVDVFLYELEDTPAEEQVALASYARDASLDRVLTTDYEDIRDDVNELNPSGTTAIGLALYKGIEGVTGVNRRRLSTPIIILMTDGRHNTDVEPIIPAREAADEQITVHTITFGSNADIDRMEAVADETGGKHYHALTSDELREVFRTIARTLPTQLTE